MAFVWSGREDRSRWSTTLPHLKRALTEPRIYKYMEQVACLELGELCRLPEIENQGIQVTRTIT
jgi:hypothetical protein